MPSEPYDRDDDTSPGEPIPMPPGVEPGLAYLATVIQMDGSATRRAIRKLPAQMRQDRPPSFVSQLKHVPLILQGAFAAVLMLSAAGCYILVTGREPPAALLGPVASPAQAQSVP